MRIFKYIVISIFLIGGLFTIGFFVIRHKAKDYISSRMNSTSLHGGTIKHASIEFTGLDGITITNLSLLSPTSDTIIQTNKLSFHISLFDLIRKKINLKSVAATDTHCYIEVDSSSTNLDFLFLKSTAQPSDRLTQQTTGFSDKLARLVQLLFRFIPNNMEIHNLNIQLSNNHVVTLLNIREGHVRNGACHIPFIMNHDTKTQDLLFFGQINKKQHELEGTLISNKPEESNIVLTQTSDKPEFFFQFEKIKFDVDFPTLNQNEVKMTAGVRIDSLHFFQGSISKDTISIPLFQSSIELDVFPNEFILNPTSEITLEELKLHPHVRLRKNKDWQIGLYLDETHIDAQKFIDALPDGLFNPVKTVHLSGLIDYHFLFEANLSNPDSLLIESEVKTTDFHIIDPGVLTKMNQDFTLPVYEDNKLVRTLHIGNSNPDFRSMQDVSPLLINAILQSEDSQFFYHRGFRLDAIREALIHDIKTKRFARGGSTISMQIVKNVFLNRNKTISRKLEEALIVWLIESNRLTSKQRMFDVYLNIVEWGPGIYGVKEASEFYFHKEPSQLTLDEAIFMASIIPRPKKFIWSLDDNGQIRESLYPHFRIVRDRLERNNIIVPSDPVELYIPQIHLTGPAATYIRNREIIEADTTNIDFTLPF